MEFDEQTKKAVLDDKSKKMLISFGIAIGIILIIIIIVLIVGVIKNSSISYSKIEDKLVEAAKKYYSNKQDALPLNDNDEVEVDATLLKEEGYIKELSKYQKDKNISCSGKVVVNKSGDYYGYFPYLNCGDKYTTEYLYEELINDVVSKDDGLYKTEQHSKDKGKETVYVFKGDYANNYLKIDNDLWRIIKINSDYSIEIIQQTYQKNNTYRDVWDNRYNNNRKENVGINDYYRSIIRREISNIYNSDKVSENLKEKIVFKDLCVATRKTNDSKNDGSIECKVTIQNEAFGLLTAYDLINASLDNSCKRIIDQSCLNYNYLANFEKSFWILTTSAEKNYMGYKVLNSVLQSRLSSTATARLVTNINKNVVFAGGSGTEEDPYLIK